MSNRLAYVLILVALLLGSGVGYVLRGVEVL